MIFLGILTAAYCGTSKLMIKSSSNGKVLSGSENLVLSSTATTEDSMFSFDKTNEVGGRKKGRLYKESKDKKKLYMYFSNLKKKVFLHSDVHNVFITKVRDCYTISDVDGNCLTVDNDSVKSAKCIKGNELQHFKISFYKPNEERDRGKLSIDSERGVKQKRNGTKYKDTIDIYVDSDEGTVKKEHQELKAKEKKSEGEMVLVEKPRSKVTHEEKEIGPIIRGVPKQTTNIVEKPSVVREKIVADVLTTTISTTIHTTSTETITKMDVITEYLPQSTITTVVIPAERILPPIYTTARGAEPPISPSVQVEKPQTTLQTRNTNLGQLEQSSFGYERVEPILPNNNLQMQQHVEPQKESQKYARRMRNSPIRRRKIQRASEEEESQDSSNSSLADSKTEEEKKKKKPKLKRRIKKVFGNLKNKFSRKKEQEKSLLNQNDKSDAESTANKREKMKNKRNLQRINLNENEESSTSSGKKKNRRALKKVNLNENEESSTSSGKKKNRRALKKVNLSENEESSTSLLRNDSKKMKHDEENNQSDVKYDSSVIKKVISENIKQDDNVFDEAKLSDFSNDLKGTEIEEIIGLENLSTKKTTTLKQPANLKVIKGTSSAEKRPADGVHYVKQVVGQYEQPVSIQPTVPVEKTFVPVKQIPQAPLKKKESHIIISQPIRVVTQSQNNQQTVKPKQQAVEPKPPYSLYPPNNQKVDKIEAKFLTNKPQEDLKIDSPPTPDLTGGVFSEFLGDLEMV